MIAITNTSALLATESEFTKRGLLAFCECLLKRFMFINPGAVGWLRLIVDVQASITKYESSGGPKLIHQGDVMGRNDDRRTSFV